MRFTIDRSNRYPVVSLRGDLDLQTAGPVRAALAEVARTTDGLVVNLGGVDFCGCTGVRMLVSFQREVCGHTVLAACPEEVFRVLAAAGAQQEVEIADTVDEAQTYLLDTVA